MDYTFERSDFYIIKNGERVRRLSGMSLYEDDDSVERDLTVKFKAYLSDPEPDDTFAIEEETSSSSEEGYRRTFRITHMPRVYNYQNQPHDTIVWGVFDD